MMVVNVFIVKAVAFPALVSKPLTKDITTTVSSLRHQYRPLAHLARTFMAELQLIAEHIDRGAHAPYSDATHLAGDKA